MNDWITIAVAALPDSYKERALRYIGKLLSSSLSKPRYTALLKKQAEQRLLPVDERRLLNVCEICQHAGELLAEEDPTTFTDTDSPYEDEWLSTFENESRHKSSQEMQERFARMLAGEIKRPGTYSIRAIKLLGQINTETASVFRTFCSGCVSFDKPNGSGLTYNSIFPTFEPKSSVYLIGKYGITNKMLSFLNEVSLLENEIQTSFLPGPVLGIRKCFIGNSGDSLSPFLYAGKYYLIKRRNAKKEVDWDFNLTGLPLSSLGSELTCIIDPEPIEKHFEDMKEFFESKELELIEVEFTNDKRWEPKP